MIIPEKYIIFLLKCFISISIGYCLGKERKRKSQIGGSRTFAIVSLSACLITIISLELTKVYDFDFVRMMSYGIASVGFLGSGLMVQQKMNVFGITTASTLFILLPINYLIGLEYYFYGITSAILVYILLESKYWKANIRIRKLK